MDHFGYKTTNKGGFMSKEACTITDRQVAFMCDCSSGFYMEKDDCEYRVFGSNTGFCYFASNSCLEALVKVNDLERLSQLQQRNKGAKNV